MKKLVNVLMLAIAATLSIGQPALAGGPGLVPDGMARVSTQIRQRFPTGVFRGMGTGLMAPAQGGGNSQSAGFRKAVWLPKPCAEAQFLYPTFYIGAGDVDVAQPLDIAGGIDEAFTQSMTVPARKPVTFNGGALSAHYDPATGPFAFIRSDTYKFDAPKQGWISIFTAIDWTSTIVTNGQPRMGQLQSQAGHFERSFTSTTSLVNSGWATTTTSLGTETANGGFAYTPYMVCKFTDGTRSVLTLGTSSGFGTAETSGSVAIDAFGDAHGNRGWPQRFLDSVGLAWTNMAKPSDDMASVVATNAFRRRLALIAALNPTDIIFQYGRNDISAGRSLAQMKDDANTIMTMIRGVLPSIGNRFYPSTILPFSAPASGYTLSTVSAADGSDQVASSGYGPGSQAQAWDDNVRALGYPWAGSPGYLDATAATMLGSVPNDYKWKQLPGTPKYFSGDLLHPSERASVELLVPYLTAHNPFGVPIN